IPTTHSCLPPPSPHTRAQKLYPRRVTACCCVPLLGSRCGFVTTATHAAALRVINTAMYQQTRGERRPDVDEGMTRATTSRFAHQTIQRHTAVQLETR